jgi:hypothetical protein
VGHLFEGQSQITNLENVIAKLVYHISQVSPTRLKGNGKIFPALHGVERFKHFI